MCLFKVGDIVYIKDTEDRFDSFLEDNNLKKDTCKFKVTSIEEDTDLINLICLSCRNRQFRGFYHYRFKKEKVDQNQAVLNKIKYLNKQFKERKHVKI